MTNIEKIIADKVVTSSSEVIRTCVEEFGISEENARKRLERISTGIVKIKGICRNGQSILYKEGIRQDLVFYEALLDTLKKSANQHYLLLRALQLYGGVIPKEKLASFSSNPVLNTRGHKSFSSIIFDLKQLDLIKESETSYSMKKGRVNELRAKTIDLVQSIVLNHFRDWARNIGLISYNSSTVNSEFSQYQFGLVAPSYIKSLSSTNGERVKPAFLLADVLVMGDIIESDVLFIQKKLENISCKNKNVRFIPFLLVTTHSQSVYQQLKASGIIVGNLEELFGNKYSEVLTGILTLVENAGVILRKSPDQYIRLIDDIEKLAVGRTYNLKGALFEMTVGLFHGLQCQSLEISKKVCAEGKVAEIDVYAIYQDRVVFAECKGYNYAVEDEYVEKWLSIKINTIRAWALSCESLQNRRVEFEIWSTGGFNKEALNRLSQMKAKTKKYSIEYFDMEKMLSIAKEKKVTSFEKVLREHYMREL